MNSANQDRAGTASGVNNAVARVASVLAIAVLGIVMVTAFSARLNQRLARLTLPSGVLQGLQTDEIRLAGLQVPAGLDPGTEAAVKESIERAFVFGFRIVMLICAGLAVASAVVAWLMIPKGGDRPAQTASTQRLSDLKAASFQRPGAEASAIVQTDTHLAVQHSRTALHSWDQNVSASRPLWSVDLETRSLRLHSTIASAASDPLRAASLAPEAPL
jgi:hypothetical protein